jgi:hypothetical protein
VAKNKLKNKSAPKLQVAVKEEMKDTDKKDTHKKDTDRKDTDKKKQTTSPFQMWAKEHRAGQGGDGWKTHRSGACHGEGASLEGP